MLDLAVQNLLSPAVLCFALGGVAVLLGSDLKLPDQIVSGLSVYLMMSIGIRGGVELAEAHWREVIGPLLGALALGCAIPIWVYGLLRRWSGLSAANAGAMAAHYGSVSAVTFAAVVALLERQGVRYEGYAPALLAVMEVPAIVVGIGLARLATATATRPAPATGGAMAWGGEPAPSQVTGIGELLNEVLSSRSIVLLAGGLAIGALTGSAGYAKVKPLFGDLFQGALCLFLLELGRLATSRAAEFRQVGFRLAAFAIALPVLHGVIGILIGYALGMSQGGAVILGTLAASASYIAAPAAVRLALPEASPAYYLTCSLAITFPFNVVFGLTLYRALAAAMYG